MRRFNRILVLHVIAAAGLLVATESNATQYLITDLGTLGSGLNSSPGWTKSVNNRGEVAGYSNYNSSFNATHAFRYSHGVLHDLGTLTPPGAVAGGSYSRAYNLNDAGVVVGYSFFQSGSTEPAHPVVFDLDGTITDLGTFRPGNNGNGEAHIINNYGVVVGQAASGADGSINYLPFILYPGSKTLISLGSLGGTRGKAYGLNDRNEVVGWSFIAGDAASHAYLYSRGAMTDLNPALAANIAGATGSEAWDINNRGIIAGTVFAAAGNHAVVYGNGQVFDLGFLSGGNSAQAEGINDRDQIVGNSVVSEVTGTTHAFLYERGVMCDLNSLVLNISGWELEDAPAISNSGYITGSGKINGATHAFLLTPVGDGPSCK
ncbi:MAG TPA: hypothetical protein VEH76_09560 [Methylocystis sp.]|nr:hypothetical protein [Methylocystis sp.]